MSIMFLKKDWQENAIFCNELKKDIRWYENLINKHEN